MNAHQNLPERFLVWDGKEKFETFYFQLIFTDTETTQKPAIASDSKPIW